MRENRTNTTVLAVLLEDAVALLGHPAHAGGGRHFVDLGTAPVFDAAWPFCVGVLLGVMALFLATLNRRLLIDTSDPEVDRAAQDWLAARDICRRP